jgi:hypothetical protein
MTTTTGTGATVDHAIGRRGRLTIRLASAELRLRAGADDRVTIRTPDGTPFPDRVVIEPVEGGLTIRERGLLGLGFGMGRRIVQLDIQVPPDAEVRIDTASGWIETDGLRGEQKLKTTSGEVRIRRGAGVIELYAVSGDATIVVDGAASLVAHSVSGDVDVRGGRLETLRVATTSGDIRVDTDLSTGTDHAIETLSGDVEIVAHGGVRVEATTVSGDLSSELPHRTEGRMGRRVLIVGDAATRLDFRSVSGDLRILDRADGAVPPPPPSVTPTAPIGSAPDDERMTILRALERGDLDVTTAMARLAELDGDESDA